MLRSLFSSKKPFPVEGALLYHEKKKSLEYYLADGREELFPITLMLLSLQKSMHFCKGLIEDVCNRVLEEVPAKHYKQALSNDKANRKTIDLDQITFITAWYLTSHIKNSTLLFSSAPKYTQHLNDEQISKRQEVMKACFDAALYGMEEIYKPHYPDSYIKLCLDVSFDITDKASMQAANDELSELLTKLLLGYTSNDQLFSPLETCMLTHQTGVSIQHFVYKTYTPAAKTVIHAHFPDWP